MEFRRVVITGLGAVTPIGNTVPEYWDALCKGVNGAGHITRFDSTKFRTRIACEVKGFDPQQYFDRKEVRKLDLYTQFAIVASDEAISDSGITKDNTDFDNVGVVFSSGIGGINSFYEEVAAFCHRRWHSALQSFHHSKAVTRFSRRTYLYKAWL